MKFVLILAMIFVGYIFGCLLWKVGSVTDFGNQPIFEYRLNILAYWTLTILFGTAEVLLINLYKRIK